ncbi:MAG: rhomboid family intramembrane serine protease [Phycisphaerae bacterium]|nr:rhomboid family intramembrane serine protease [Phycisphaerae bacterium]
MLIPIGTDRPQRRRPLVNTSLVFVNLVAFMASSYLGRTDPAGAQQLLEAMALDPEHPRAATLFTYAFLHADFFHVLGNMVVLWVFGASVEDRYGHLGYLTFYLAGAAAAGGVHCALERGPVIGASGAVAAVTGAALVFFPRTHVRCLVFFFVIGVFAIPAWWFIAFAIAKDIYLTGAGKSGNIATWAHLGGYAAGVGVAVFLLSTRLLPRESWDLLAIVRHAERRRQIREAVVVREKAERSAAAQEPSPESVRLAELRERCARRLGEGDIAAAAGAYEALLAGAGDGPGAALSRRHQIDLANALFAAGAHRLAGAAYERFARAYAADPEAPRAWLMVALIATRYTGEPARAAAALDAAEPRLRDAELDALAKSLRAAAPRAGLGG